MDMVTFPGVRVLVSQRNVLALFCVSAFFFLLLRYLISGPGILLLGGIFVRKYHPVHYENVFIAELSFQTQNNKVSKHGKPNKTAEETQIRPGSTFIDMSFMQ